MKLSTDWLNSVLTKNANEAWVEIFKHLKGLIPTEESDVKTSYRTLEEDIAYIDHVLSSSAWDLWKDFSDSPRASDNVKKFWNETTGPKAVLILDSLSMREINPIITEIKKAGLTVKGFELSGSEIPSETDIYANALGISGRASLARNNIPRGILINTDQTFVDSFIKIPFDETSSKIPNEKNIFIWHGWPDDALHDLGSVDDAFNRFIDHIGEIIKSNGFIDCIKMLTQGRELLITSDHGYCNTSSFSPATGEHHQELKILGHTRSKKMSEIAKCSGKTIPPATMEMKATATDESYRVAVGRIRPSDRGFPVLTHGGLSLMECTVPMIRVSQGK